MANNTVSIGIDVSDNGSTTNLIKKVKNLKDLLTQTAAIASSINVGGTAGGGTTRPASGGTGGIAGGAAGSRGAASPRAPASSGPSAAASSYTMGRGVSGTGASSRDFAHEAEGLGGLVRLYATFAANIFAATMAFSALSKAMDTTNMIAGLDQLGAQSGKSLGALAKNLVDVTGGAISLREAMTATAQASAAGMSSKDILRMGVAAKNASSILGVDMTDALSRLSRGITKLEPELLDELGIFTKLTQSNNDYALKLGKSALALTDFEKRQGFANAVLAETESKFGAIKVDVNPYSQLSAALKNTSQTTLAFVNEALGPLVKMLSESPTALLAGLILIGGFLIKQAIPALSQFGMKLHQTATMAEAKALEIQATLASLGPPRSGIMGFDLQRIALDRIAASAKLAAASFRILANAVDNTKLLGFSASIELLKAEIRALGTTITATQAKILLFKGIIASGVTSIGTLASAFGGAVLQIFTVVAVLGMISSALGKNAKEAQATSSAMDTLDDALKNVDRTLTAISAKPFLAQLTADSLAARGTAFKTLTDGMIDTITKAQDEIANRNPTDTFINWLYSWIGKDTETKLAAQLGDSLNKVFKIAGSTVDLTDFKTKFTDILNLPAGTSDGGLLAALKTAAPDVQALAAADLGTLSEKFNNLTQNAKDFNAELLSTGKLYDEIGVKYQVTDSSAKLGERQAKDALALNIQLQDTNTAIGAMISIVNDVNKLKLFEPADAIILVNMKDQINSIGNEYQINNNVLDIEKQLLTEINAKIAEKQTLLDKAKAKGADRQDLVREIKALESSRGVLPQEVTRREGVRTELGGNLEFLSKQFSIAATNSFIAGSNRISAAILESFNKAKLVIQSAALSLFPENKATIKEQADIARAQIDSDILKLKSDADIIDSQERLRMAYENSERIKGIGLKVGEAGYISPTENSILKDIAEFQTKFLDKKESVSKEAVADFTKLREDLTAGKKVTAVVMNAVNNAQALLNKRGGVEGAIGVKEAERVAISMKEAAQDRLQTSKETIRLIDVAISNIDRSSQLLQQKLGGMTVVQGLSAQQGLADEKRTQDFKKQQEPLKAAQIEALKTGSKKQQAIAKTNLDNLTAEQNAAAVTAKELDRIALVRAEITDKATRQAKVDADIEQLSATIASTDKSRLDFASQQLDYDLSVGKINQDEYDTKKRVNTLLGIEQDYNKSIYDILAKTKVLNDKIETDKALALAAGPMTPERAAQFAADTSAVKAQSDAEVAAAKVTYDLRVQGAKLGDDINERTRTYADAFKSTVSSMSDALVDFAMTGKLNFGDMIKSMILDLVKFEQKKMMMSAFDAAGGFMGMAKSVVGMLGFGGAGAGAASGGVSSLSNFTDSISAPSFAKGGAFDQGRVAFAKGGAFTNTIVHKPTTFAFAKGTGLMGEAGPEAIMPLTRGPNGSLGVQNHGGGGGKVDVVVNNYGQEKATTKETTDSRGNRKIQVIIGEAVASEMNRSNSPVQSSMKNTFGLQPALTRR